MDRRWTSDTYNGNTDSASDLEAPCDLYSMVDVDRGLQRDVSQIQEQRNRSNMTPQESRGRNSYLQGLRMPENEYVNTANILAETPRKKSLLALGSLPENVYVNVDALKERGQGSFRADHPSSVCGTEVTSTNRPSCSDGSISQVLRDKTTKILLLASPNNNNNNTDSCTIPSSNSTGSKSGNLSIFKGTSKVCPTPCESKSAWQFYLEYGTPKQDVESSEETPSPSSDASPDIVLSEGSIDSLSEGGKGYDSGECLTFGGRDEISHPQSHTLLLLNNRSQNTDVSTPSTDHSNNNSPPTVSSDRVGKIGVDRRTSCDMDNSLGLGNLNMEVNNLMLSPQSHSQPSPGPSVPVSSLNLKPSVSSSSSGNLDKDNMADSLSDFCSSSPDSDRPPCALGASMQPVGASCRNSLAPTKHRNDFNMQAPVRQQNQSPILRNNDQSKFVLKQPRRSQNSLKKSATGERFISLQDFTEPFRSGQAAAQDRACTPAANFSRPHPVLASTDRFCCWQRSSEHIDTCRRSSRRPLSLHELEVRPSFMAGESSSAGFDARSPRCTCTSRQTQTESGKLGMLRQSNSFSAMPRSTSWWGRRSDEGIRIGNKVNLGVSSLRSAYPVVRRQPSFRFPTSQTSENLRVVNALGSSQSTPSFVGLCHLNGPPKRQHIESHGSRETGWKYTRPVSDSGLFIKHARFSASKLKTSQHHVPDLSSQISEGSQVTPREITRAKDNVKRQTQGSRKSFARRLSDPSYSLPQPPRRSESLSGTILLARSLSEPYMKSFVRPCNNSGFDPKVSMEQCAVSSVVTEHPPIIYENVQSRAEGRIDSEPHELATYENVPAKLTEPRAEEGSTDDHPTIPKTPPGNAACEVSSFVGRLYASCSSDSLDSDSSSEDCVMADRANLVHSDSSDSDTDDGSDSAENYAGSSEDSSDTISMDDLLTRLGVVTGQDGDADDEDGFLDSSDEEDEDELLLPVTAPSRMCDRPPSPYPGLGDSSDDDHPLSISALFETRNRTSRDAATLETPEATRRQPVPPRSRTEQDFMDFEILIPEDYGLEHPPSYTDLFPVGMPSLPEMPPSYDDAVRPISVHQDHFDYASFQDHRVNNRLSLQLPWVSPGDEYLSNPPPAYDDAVYNASGGRSHEELSYQSPSDSPIRRSRGRRILNGLRRFARKIFR